MGIRGDESSGISGACPGSSSQARHAPIPSLLQKENRSRDQQPRQFATIFVRFKQDDSTNLYSEVPHRRPFFFILPTNAGAYI